MYDELTTLMLDATDALVPPSGAASRALRTAAKSKKRSAILAGTGGVAAVGLLAAGATQVPRGSQLAYVRAQPPGACSSSASLETPTASPAQLSDQDKATQTDDPGFNALTLPNTLPAFPINLWTHPTADSFQTGGNNSVHTGPGNRDISAPVRLFGWDAAPYIEHSLGDGNLEGTPGGPQLRLDIVDRPDVYAPRSDGRVQDRSVDGSLTVCGKPALVSHDADDKYVTLTYGRFSISAMGGSGATVDDLVMSIEAIGGLNAARPAPSTSPTSPTSPVSPTGPTGTPTVPDLPTLPPVLSATRLPKTTAATPSN